MILSDGTLRQCGDTIVYPFDPERVQPASIDLTLDSVFLKAKPRPEISLASALFQSTDRGLTGLEALVREGAIDLANLERTGPEYYRIEGPNYLLGPHEFILGSTAERIEMPTNMVGSVEGRSSLGRLGLFVHVTAGFIDPGFRGKITLEILNVNDRPIILRSGLRICQLALTNLDVPAKRPYGHPDLGSHYQDQDETTASRYDG